MTRCAVWGAPIGHSLSPVLHRAAYAALDLRDWSYEQREVEAAGFAQALVALDESWRGLSLTMPLKEVALEHAESATDRARRTGAANTLLRTSSGWSADNTDVHGIVHALQEVGARAVDTMTIIGSGATARSALAACAELGVRAVTFMVRREVRPETLAQAAESGLATRTVRLGAWQPTDVVLSTVPPESVSGLERLPVPRAPGAGFLLDVVYGGGETPLQRAARRAGWVVAEGTSMLLHQACEQVRLMTGHAAPVDAMRAALETALAARRADAAGAPPR
jgi:shikimate dehydrogenase